MVAFVKKKKEEEEEEEVAAMNIKQNQTMSILPKCDLWHVLTLT